MKTKKAKKIKKSKPKKVVVVKSSQRYALNANFEFFQELKTLILKSSPAEKDKLVKRLYKLGRIKLAILSGIFLSNGDGSNAYDNSIADLFIVGDDMNRRKLTSFLQSLEAEMGKEIKFSLMEREEFDYRYRMFDRFVRVLLEGPHIKIINKLGI